jgi:LCP family protein required for cell wall assembly
MSRKGGERGADGATADRGAGPSSVSGKPGGRHPAGASAPSPGKSKVTGSGKPGGPAADGQAVRAGRPPGKAGTAGTAGTPPGTAGTPGTAGRTPKGRFSRRGKVLAWLSGVAAVVVVAGTLTVYLRERAVYDSIRHVAVTGLGNRPPQYSTTALNLLVFGTDDRAGLSAHLQNALHVGHVQGNNTDTIVIVHISPGRGKVTALSIPRDTMVPAYACPAGPHWPGQQADPTAQVQVNSLFAIGGPGCLWKSLEQLTGIRIQHFLELGFTGFVKAVNDVGGVNVCVPFAVNDPNSGLVLAKGEHHINGAVALEFWRTRYSVSDGTDLTRIQRDQYLLAQVLHGVLRQGLLGNPMRMLNVIRDLASSLTTDSGLDQNSLVSIGGSLSHISTASVQFITVPNTPDPMQTSQVVLAQPQAGQLFSAIAHDTTLPTPASTKTPAAKPPTVLTVDPAQVKVTVLNGSGVSGLAAQAATDLTGRGYTVMGKGDATSYTYTSSVIQYGSAATLPMADTLKQEFTSVTVQHNPQVPAGTVQLILGSNFTALASHAPAKAKTPGQPVSGLAKSYGGITGNASCSSDTAAFQGPNSP